MPRAARAEKAHTKSQISQSNQDTSLPEVFRRIYYHLYTNSDASRAELIIEDLSLLLLCKLAAETNGGADSLAKYANGNGSANSTLLPVLKKAFPTVLDSDQKFTLSDQPIRSALAELQRSRLSDAPAHALGEAFQALMGPRLRGEKGQFFTPKSLVRAMVEIIDPKPSEHIADPACGTGGFLSESHIYQKERYPGLEFTGKLVGVDKDSGLARLASALLKIVTGDHGTVYDFNALSAEAWREHSGDEFEGQFDVILTNPPFGSRIAVTQKEILQYFDFGKSWLQEKKAGRWTRSEVVAGSQDPQILFLEFCVRALKPGGRMGIVLPEGVFGNKNTSYVWDWLEQQGDVFALLDCPRTTFQPGTDTKTNVLFFRKEKSVTCATRIAVALNCGHDRRGRSHLSDGSSYPDDFPKLAKDFHASESSIETWKPAVLKGQRYLVPRYHFDVDVSVDTEKELLRGAQTISLAELVRKKVISVKKGHEVGSDAYGTGDIPFVRTSDISNFEISTDPTKSVGEAIYDLYSPQQRLRPGDILMVVDGRYRIGSTAMLVEHNFRCVVQSHIRVISVENSTKLDPYELLFALSLPSVKLRIRNLVFIQSTLGTLGSRLMELKIPMLHGDGPWAPRIERFRETLKRRADLLADLKRMAAEDVEL